MELRLYTLDRIPVLEVLVMPLDPVERAELEDRVQRQDGATRVRVWNTTLLVDYDYYDYCHRCKKPADRMARGFRDALCLHETAGDKAARVVVSAQLGNDDAGGVGRGVDEAVVADIDAHVSDVVAAGVESAHTARSL